MVTRFRWWRLALAVACCTLPFARAYGADTAHTKITLVLETNKQTYLVGEPVLLRTTLSNKTGSAYEVGRFRMIRRPGNFGHLGFTVTVADKDGPLGDLSAHVQGSPHSNVPTHSESFLDRYAFPKQLEADLTLYRLDICAFAKPGTYRLKAALVGEEDRSIETGAVTVKVVPADEADDPVASILSEQQTIAFGYSFVDVFYLDGHVFGSGVSLGWDELRPILRAVLKQGHESALYPYARYLWFLRNRDWSRGGGTAKHALATQQSIETAEAFLKDYPDSWLAPDAMRVLFFTYLAYKHSEKALPIGNRALALDPVPTVVPTMRFRERVDKLQAIATADANATLTLQTTKQTYLVGEPILLRTTLHNGIDEPYEVGPFRMMMFGGGGPYAHLGFSVDVKRGDEALGSIFEPSHDAPLGAAPRHHEGICDRGAFPAQIGAGQTVYRIDMCSLEEPGTYQLSAYLAGDKGRRIDSDAVEIEVLPLDDSDDPITGLLDHDTILALGRSIVVAYYVDGEATDYGGAMNPDKLTPIIQTVLTRGRESAFYEPARHIALLRQRDERRSMRSQLVLASAEAIQAAEAFLKDDPDSWLAPDVMRVLFFTHLANKHAEKALEIGNPLLALDPAPNLVPALAIPERIDGLSTSDHDQVANDAH